jgi:hypothetical protein
MPAVGTIDSGASSEADVSASHAAIHTAMSAAARNPASAGTGAFTTENWSHASTRSRRIVVHDRCVGSPYQVVSRTSSSGAAIARPPADTTNETIVLHPSRRQPTARRCAATAVVASTGRKVKSAKTRM